VCVCSVGVIPASYNRAMSSHTVTAASTADTAATVDAASAENDELSTSARMSSMRYCCCVAVVVVVDLRESPCHQGSIYKSLSLSSDFKVHVLFLRPQVFIDIFIHHKMIVEKKIQSKK